MVHVYVRNVASVIFPSLHVHIPHIVCICIHRKLKNKCSMHVYATRHGMRAYNNNMRNPIIKEGLPGFSPENKCSAVSGCTAACTS